ncbi:MAG: hypothetical protein FWD69_07510 [Polyangiaceae bacterium]|nr:hypothetical protein [Polyangiaceae bacterium]
MRTPSARPNNGATTAAIFAAGIGLCLTLAAYVIEGARSSLSVALGAVVAVANLLAMRAIITSLIVPPDKNASDGGATSTPAHDEHGETADESSVHEREGKRGGLVWGVFAVLKIFILFGVIWLLLARKIAEPISFVVGYGAMPLGIVVSTLATALSPR